MRSHSPFHMSFIWAAILLALGGGFGIGAHLAFVIAFGFDLGPAFAGMVQAHGHLQLVGWAGLFIMGVSLFMVPRLTSSAPVSPACMQLIALCMLGGLLLRTFAQLRSFYVEAGAANRLLGGLFITGTLAEAAGVLLYAAVLFRAIRSRPSSGSNPAMAIPPFLAIMLPGWLLFSLGTAALSISVPGNEGILLAPDWSRLLNDCFLYLVLLPTSFGFSANTFPVFLRLRVPTWPVRTIAAGYGLCAAAGLALQLVLSLGAAPSAAPWYYTAVLARSAFLLVVLWNLEILLLPRRPWIEDSELQQRVASWLAEAREKFGRFDLSIRLAYLWLLCAVIADAAIAAAMLLGYPPPLPVDAVRHLYLLGFITHLILGMAVRMIPGFLGASRISLPGLVSLMNGAAAAALLCRVLPLLIGGTAAANAAFGISGLLALAAVLLLAALLAATQHAAARSRK